jgi:F-type H+-transporting ATPase subunit epsilon
MSKQLILKIITPEKVILEESVDQVTIPTTEGEITVLPGHIPLVAILGKGDIVAKTNGEDVPFVAVGGFIRVNDNEVAVMADFAEHVASITDDEIEKAKAHAKELQEQFDKKEIVDFEHFESELQRSLTRTRIADKWKSKKYRR